jgi:hypothetical protein
VQLFAGFVVRGVRNTCVFNEGLLPNLWVKDQQELSQAVYELLCAYDAVDQLGQLERMLRFRPSAQQVVHLFGRTMLYQQLSSSEQAKCPEFLFTDYQMSSVTGDYLQDERFGREKDGSISLWQLYNLLLSADKSSHPDLFLERGANAACFIAGLANALEPKRSIGS